MMRVTPLAVWCSKLTNEEVEKATKADASITHSQQLVHNVIATYVVGIKYLIQNPGEANRAKLAYEAALEFASQSHIVSNVKTYLEQAVTLHA